MLNIKPVSENEADRDTVSIYRSIKQTFGLESVPLVFQYLAAFPYYFSSLWNQLSLNFSDPSFQKEASSIAAFSHRAMDEVFKPQPATVVFLEKIANRPEQHELVSFSRNSISLNSSLYYISLSIRESLKGRYLGIKQIGEKLERKEAETLSDVSEGFSVKSVKDPRQTFTDKIKEGLQRKESGGLATSLYGDFFKIINWEMAALVKKQEYLERRVELERYALSLLPLIPHPLDSSLTTVIRQTEKQENFPELIYLISDIFPTQMPYKLLASTVMEEALTSKPSQSENLTPGKLAYKK